VLFLFFFLSLAQSCTDCLSSSGLPFAIRGGFFSCQVGFGTLGDIFRCFPTNLPLLFFPQWGTSGIGGLVGGFPPNSCRRNAPGGSSSSPFLIWCVSPFLDPSLSLVSREKGSGAVIAATCFPLSSLFPPRRPVASLSNQHPEMPCSSSFC